MPNSQPGPAALSADQEAAAAALYGLQAAAAGQVPHMTLEPEVAELAAQYACVLAVDWMRKFFRLRVGTRSTEEQIEEFDQSDVVIRSAELLVADTLGRTVLARLDSTVRQDEAPDGT